MLKREDLRKNAAIAGIEARAPLPTSAPLQAAVARLRQEVAPLGQDRYLAPDLVAAAGLVAADALAQAAGGLLDEVRA